jgi:hypothetical protein
VSARRIPLGFVGGGARSLIGGVHRGAAALSERFDLKGGVFGTDAARDREHVARLRLDPARAYPDLDELLAAEAARAAGDRIEAVAVLTPNHLHAVQVGRLLDAGLHVFCEKPFTTRLDEALALAGKARERARVVAIAHTYTGYPMVRQLRAMVAEGAIGAVQKIDVQYYQGWINPAMHDAARRAGIWRLDPSRAGPSCCFGDIGVHAFDLAEYVTGQRIERVLAELDGFAEGNPLDVDGTVLFRTEAGVRGLVRASQIATGEENDLCIAVYGRSGALKWRQENPNELLLLREDGPQQRFTPGHAFNTKAARHASQLPPGHPQGLVEAMANLYRGFAAAIDGDPAAHGAYRDADAGVRGLRFLEAVLASQRGGNAWKTL